MSERMPLAEAMKALYAVRQDDDVVVTLMGTAREWTRLGKHPLDFVLVPSSMGQGTSLGLGMALAQPTRKVVVCNGDGSMLMNLGSLVTISAQSPANLTVIVFDNGVYEVTGGQATPAAALSRADRGEVDFAEVARSCGFQSAHTVGNLEDWQKQVRGIVDETGPTFVWVKVAAVADAGPPIPPGPGSERAKTFRAAMSE